MAFGKPTPLERRPVVSWADNESEITHYDPAGHALLICEKCLADPTLEKVAQAITIKQGFALCEWHWKELA